MSGQCNTCETNGVCDPNDPTDDDCTCSSPEVVAGTNYFEANCAGPEPKAICNSVTISPDPSTS